MNRIFFTLCFLMNLVAYTQSEEAQVKATINNYIEGTSYSNPEQVQSAFYEEAELFLSHKEKELWIVPIKEYIDKYVANKEKGKFNGRTGNILSVDIENNIATAKAEIIIKKANLRFIDLFLLKKINKEWKIISKAATRMPEE